MATKRLTIPLSQEDVRGLKVGDIVYLDGLIYTARSLFQLQVVEQDILPPIDFSRLNVMVHIGPVMKKVGDSWMPVSMAPTSSIRFEKLGPTIIKKLGVRAFIGKTTMGEKTMQAMKEYGCVHLSVVGVMGNIFAKQVKRVVEVHNLELGIPEATWVMEVENAGPFIVDIDTHGNNLFHQVNAEVEKRFDQVYEKYGLKDFAYTNVGA
ncbi:MAG TPA: fumarate hydratase [Dehalococcoidia bacterium]|jgi:tartrate/fumarate subfamily iron-sulfur-dependent hydro-lyase beta chain|nr:fumarate hydratase [Dehalococcoidia bacterium]